MKVNTLAFTKEETEVLLSILEQTLREMRVEEHRTRTPSYREIVLNREHLVESIVSKLQQVG